MTSFLCSGKPLSLTDFKLMISYNVKQHYEGHITDATFPTLKKKDFLLFYGFNLNENKSYVTVICTY